MNFPRSLSASPWRGSTTNRHLTHRALRPRPRFWYLRKVLKWSVIAFLAAFIVSPDFRNVVTEYALSFLPDSYEHDLGDMVFDHMRAGGQLPVIVDEDLERDFARIMDPIRQNAGPAGQNLRVNLVNSSQINAFAMPGGHIVVYSELILEAESPEEIAGVLAHETGHVVKHHCMKRIAGIIGTRALLSILIRPTSTGRISTLSRICTTATSMHYSREYEAEADREAFASLRRAHLDTSAYRHFFERLGQRNKSESRTLAFDVFTALMSSHPMPAERALAIREMETAVGAGQEPTRAIDIDFLAFKDKLRKRIGRPAPTVEKVAVTAN